MTDHNKMIEKWKEDPVFVAEYDSLEIVRLWFAQCVRLGLNNYTNL